MILADTLQNASYEDVITHPHEEEAGRSTENLSVPGGDTQLMSGTDVHLLASPSAAGLLAWQPCDKYRTSGISLHTLMCKC